MSNRETGITPEQFQQLNHLMGMELDISTPSLNAEAECGRVISLEDFRQSRGLESKQRQKARSRASQLLKVIAGITRDYEGQMLAIAHERSREDWKAQTGYDPYEQIAFDVERLQGLLAHLNWALEDQGAATLSEALEILKKTDDEVLLGTIEYVANSEYVGFQILNQIFRLGDLASGEYAEDEAEVALILETLKEKQFIFSIEPLRSLQDREALAS